MISNKNVSELKCYSCGMTFKTNQHLIRHKNRKTPCLIREVAPEGVHNPNRCIFCNKIFSSKSNLQKHLNFCKIKNGGMNILDEKVRYEQEIRMLKEQRNEDRNKIDNLYTEMELMKNLLTTIQIPPQTVNNMVTTNNTINQNINQNVIINFYNYDTPKVDTLKLTRDDLHTDSINKKLIELIYFNKAIPENHVLYRPNIKEQRVLIYADKNWKNISGEALAPVFVNIKNAAYLAGHDKINSGEIFKSDDEFLELPIALQTSIRDFNMGQGQINDGAIMEIITENREIVKATRDLIE